MRRAEHMIILLIYLVGISIFIFAFGCSRNVHKMSDEVKIEQKQTSQENHSWQRESVTEVVYDTLWRTVQETLRIPEIKVVEVPQPYVIRQTVRESGEASKALSQDLKSETRTEQVDKITPILNQISYLIVALCVMVAILLGVIALRKR